MPHYRSPHRSATPPSYPYSDFYPGINSFESSDLPIKAEASALAPFSPAAGGSLTTLPAAAADTAASTASGFSLANIGGMIERLGGIEGILATMGKVQKVMQTVQQFAPMAKMFAGLLPGGKGPKVQGGNLDEYKPQRRRRSKKGRKSSSGSRSRKKTVKRRR
ncbi:hypothetical protein DFP94_1154 [Fontibacillus phaseoli]|uniref:YqfQ-like protein n=1 Tax=Fontibacillus phaseoli TaxID=1416533 RepID=A0A369B1M9_9BACL|nr:hypothetical protein [Fontibacillus phaseoli]RCX15321.1 hypothetical protein DFP94_1154 [Fontibacillus phaseoli]